MLPSSVIKNFIKKISLITAAVIEVIIFGFILPIIIIPPTKIGPILREAKNQVMEPISALFITAKIIPNKNSAYQNRCSGQYEQILIQTYTWMMIPGPVIEDCVIRDRDGKITDDNGYGKIKKGVIYPNF